MRIRPVLATIAAVLWTGAVLAQAHPQAQAPDPNKVAEGRQVFKDSKCSKCHGIEGRGEHDQRVLRGVGEKLSAAEIRQWITHPAEMTAKLPKKPKEPMKKVDLTEAQVDALVAYLQSLKK